MAVGEEQDSCQRGCHGGPQSDYFHKILNPKIRPQGCVYPEKIVRKLREADVLVRHGKFVA